MKKHKVEPVKDRMKAAFLTTVPDEKIPVKVYAEYDGPVPAQICDYLANRIIGCAKDGFCFPALPMDVYGDIWQALERRARNMPTLETAAATTYLHRTVDNLLRKYFERTVKPKREEYRLTEGRINTTETVGGPDLDAPEGKDVGFAASAAATEGYDYDKKRVGNIQPLTAQQLAENLADEPWAHERRQQSALVLCEIYEALRASGCAEGETVVRAFQAYVTADGNLVEAAHLAGIGKTKFYKSWNRWLKVAKNIAEKSDACRN